MCVCVRPRVCTSYQICVVWGIFVVDIFPMFFILTIGETDWKVLAIDVTDPLAEKLNGEN